MDSSTLRDLELVHLLEIQNDNSVNSTPISSSNTSLLTPSHTFLLKFPDTLDLIISEETNSQIGLPDDIWDVGILLYQLFPSDKDGIARLNSWDLLRTNV